MKALLASATTGTNGKTNQKSSATALMVLLLSTALFAIPGFKEQYGKSFILKTYSGNGTET